MQSDSGSEGERAKEHQAILKLAASDCVLMVGPAIRKRKANYSNGDLVIVDAIYGDVDAFKEQETSHVGLDRYNPTKLLNAKGKWLDVTIPVQFMCKNDKLVLHGGIHKHQLMGFCKTLSDDERESLLLVRYLYKSRCYEVLVSDSSGLNAPQDAHLVDDELLASKIQMRAKQIVEEEGAEDIVATLLN